MPTRKQRKRRQKDRRHEWEEVLVYPDGREVPVEEADEEELPVPPRREPRARAAKAEPAKRSARRGRDVPPPSWRRVVKRSAIFAPLMYVFILLTQRDASPVGQVLFTLQLLLIFIPFSYVMDVVTYRIWKKRADRAESAASKGR